MHIRNCGNLSEDFEPIRRLETLFNDDREPVETLAEATWKYVFIISEEGEITEQYSVDIIDGVDQEYVGAEEFQKKSIVDNPPYGKDIVNNERKYGTISGYKLYPYGRVTEEFVEQEHPRDSDGKFAGKSVVRTKYDQLFKDDTKIDFEIQENHIKKAKLDLKKLVDMKEDWGINTTDYKEIVNGQPFEQWADMKIGIWERRVQTEESKLVELHNMLDSFDDRPVIKIKDLPNTHKVGEKGFKTGVKKFKGLKLSDYRRGEPIIVGGITKEEMGGTFIDSSLNKNASELALKNYELIKDVWNELPDEDRNLIDVLKFRFSNTDLKNMGSHHDRIEINGRIFTPEYIEIQLSNSLSTGTSAINTLVHEVGHAKFTKIERQDPEKVKEFNRKMREVGYITPYQKIYQNKAKETEYDNIKQRASREYKELNDIQRKNAEIHMARKLEQDELIFGNEAHSEFYAMLHAPTLNYGHRISQEYMEKVAQAYKELHDIEE